MKVCISQLFKSIFFITSFLFITQSSWAQPELPAISGATQKAVNVITWSCQYDGVKSIAVLRSSDSASKFVTIGYVKNVKKGVQAYIDGHPLAGNNYYKLVIAFSSGWDWKSDRILLQVDSQELVNAPVLPPNDSLQSLINGSVITIDPSKPISATTTPTTTTIVNPKTGDTIVKKDTVQTNANISIDMSKLNATSNNSLAIKKSIYVFTNPFNGHINVEIPNAEVNNYSIDFFDEQGNHVFTIGRVRKKFIVVDKRNFQKKGMFKFFLYKGEDLFEKGYININ